MKPLYKIANEYMQALNDSYIDDELKTFDQVTILNNLNEDFEDKAVNIAAYIKNIDAEAEIVRSAIKEMQDRVKRLDNKSEQLANYLRMAMTGCGIKEIRKSPHYVIKIKTNPPKVYIDPLMTVPPEYLRIKTITEVDKKKIADEIKNGVILDFAKLVQETKLEIK